MLIQISWARTKKCGYGPFDVGICENRQEKGTDGLCFKCSYDIHHPNENLLRKKHSQIDNNIQSMEKRLKQLPSRTRLPANESVIEYFENLKRMESHLYSMSQIVLAVPCTQVTAERAFSALGLILTERRIRLSETNLANILFVKLNSELFNNVEIDYNGSKWFQLLIDAY